MESDHCLRHLWRMPSVAAQEPAYRLDDIRSLVDQEKRLNESSRAEQSSDNTVESCRPSL
jgi:hypothetical protein